MNFKNVKRSLLSLALTASMLVPQTAMAADVEVAGTENATQTVDVSMEIKSAYSVSLPATIELEYDAAKVIGDETLEGFWYNLKYGVAGTIAPEESVYCRPVFPSSVTNAEGAVYEITDPNKVLFEEYEGNFTMLSNDNFTQQVESDELNTNFLTLTSTAINTNVKIALDNIPSSVKEVTTEFDVKFNGGSIYDVGICEGTSIYFKISPSLAGGQSVELSEDEWYHVRHTSVSVDNSNNHKQSWVVTNSASEVVCEKPAYSVSGAMRIPDSVCTSLFSKGASVSIDNVVITSQNSPSGSCQTQWTTTEIGTCDYDYSTSTISNCTYNYCCENGHPVGIVMDEDNPIPAGNYTGQLTFEFGLEKE